MINNVCGVGSVEWRVMPKKRRAPTGGKTPRKVNKTRKVGGGGLPIVLGIKPIVHKLLKVGVQPKGGILDINLLSRAEHDLEALIGKMEGIAVNKSLAARRGQPVRGLTQKVFLEKSRDSKDL